jgi:hypothetical protein
MMKNSKNYFCFVRRELLSEELLAYASTILKATNFNTILFLTALTKQIHQDFIVEYREIGSPLPPDETFNLKKRVL